MDGNEMKAIAKAFLTEFSSGDMAAACARTNLDTAYAQAALSFVIQAPA